MNNPNWFRDWSLTKISSLWQGGTFSPREEYVKIASEFEKPVEVKELNPELDRPGKLGAILDQVKRGKIHDYYYAATAHPNVAELEARVKALEVGNLSHPQQFGCLVFNAGMAAIAATLETLAKGRHGIFIYDQGMYPSTRQLLINNGNGRNMVGTLPGFEVDMESPDRLDNALNILEKHTNVLGVIFEPVKNPTIAWRDTKALAGIAHKYGVPVIVDNTFLTSYLFEPFRAGADIVISSLTKYPNGEGDLLGGAVVAPAGFIPGLLETRKHKRWIMAPHDAYRCAQRITTLPKRMDKHCENAAAIANRLNEYDDVSVNYQQQSDIRNANPGGVLSFVFIGGRDTASCMSMKFTEYLYENRGPVRQAVSLGEPRTLVLPYAGQIGDIKFLFANDIPTGLVRVAVGRERNIDGIADYIAKGIEHTRRWR